MYRLNAYMQRVNEYASERAHVSIGALDNVDKCTGCEETLVERT